MKEYTIDHPSLSMALVDAVPVVFFALSAWILTGWCKNWMFVMGCWLVVLAGSAKVLWKLLLAVSEKNFFFLNTVFRAGMLAGFGLMVLFLFVHAGNLDWIAILKALTGFYQCLFFAAGAAGMVCMAVLGKRADPSKAGNNWLEQCINLAAQGCFLAGLCLIAWM